MTLYMFPNNNISNVKHYIYRVYLSYLVIKPVLDISNLNFEMHSYIFLGMRIHLYLLGMVTFFFFFFFLCVCVNIIRMHFLQCILHFTFSKSQTIIFKTTDDFNFCLSFPFSLKLLGPI